MSLTLRAELALKDVGLVDFYNGDPKPWRTLAKRTYDFMAAQYPSGVAPRPDDIAETLVPLLGVNKSLRKYLQENKLKQRYWITRFADLILDRLWSTISS